MAVGIHYTHTSMLWSRTFSGLMANPLESFTLNGFNSPLVPRPAPADPSASLSLVRMLPPGVCVYGLLCVCVMCAIGFCHLGKSFGTRGSIGGGRGHVQAQPIGAILRKPGVPAAGRVEGASSVQQRPVLSKGSRHT